MKIKSKIFSISASCDRGFSSSSEDRKMIDILVEKLQAMNPTVNCTKNLFPYKYDSSEDIPLQGNQISIMFN